MTIISWTLVFLLYYTLDIVDNGILDMWKFGGVCNFWKLGIDFTLYFMTILINSNQSCSFLKWRVFKSIPFSCINGPRKVEHKFLSIFWNLFVISQCFPSVTIKLLFAVSTEFLNMFLFLVSNFSKVRPLCPFGRF